MNQTFPARIDNLYDMLDFVKEQAASTGFTGSELTKIELAMEETIVNIISYGYPDQVPGMIIIQCTPSERKGLRIIVKDQGISYDPLKNGGNVDPRKSIEEKTLGGYGIMLIKKLMDEVQYSRENDQNVLVLIKYLGSVHKD